MKNVTARSVARLISASALVLTVCSPTRLIAAEGQSEPRPVEYYRDVRGSIVFKTYCVLCHGSKGDGKGRAAEYYNPPPANLTLSKASDEYKENIIRRGGAAMGRSPFMPPWGQELTDEQVKDVVYYLRVINVGNLRKKK